VGKRAGSDAGTFPPEHARRRLGRLDASTSVKRVALMVRYEEARSSCERSKCGRRGQYWQY
jgi:hypothetical protein